LKWRDAVRNGPLHMRILTVLSVPAAVVAAGLVVMDVAIGIDESVLVYGILLCVLIVVGTQYPSMCRFIKARQH